MFFRTNSELILSLTSRLSMSQGTSNAVATAATITSAAAPPANVITRGNFMGLTAAASYFSILFSKRGGCFSATMVRFTAATNVDEKSSFDLNIRPLKPPRKNY